MASIQVSPFSLGLNSAVDLGIEVEGPDPETHGLAGLGGLLYSLRNKPWVLDVLLQLLQHGVGDIVLWVGECECDCKSCLAQSRQSSVIPLS